MSHCSHTATTKSIMFWFSQFCNFTKQTSKTFFMLTSLHSDLSETRVLNHIRFLNTKTEFTEATLFTTRHTRSRACCLSSCNWCSVSRETYTHDSWQRHSSRCLCWICNHSSVSSIKMFRTQSVSVSNSWWIWTELFKKTHAVAVIWELWQHWARLSRNFKSCLSSSWFIIWSSSDNSIRQSSSCCCTTERIYQQQFSSSMKHSS